MKQTIIIYGSTLASLALVAVLSAPARGQVQGSLPSYVKLQATTPGLTQTGHLNISGTALVNYLGVGRTTPLAGTELLGIKGEAPIFNGMNIEGPFGSRPYYGYATAGTIRAWTEFADTNGNLNLVNNNKYLTWSSVGYLGVGTQSPSSSIDVRNGNIALTNGSGLRVLENYIGSATGSGIVQTKGPAGKSTNFFSTSLSPNTGYLGVCDTTGTTAAFIFVDDLARGNIVGDIKNFRVSNPRNESEDIYYASIEGPEAAAYTRGTARMVNGKAHISLPQHFSDLTVGTGMTVLLTPKDPSSKGLGYWHGTNSCFDVFEINSGTGTYDFDWEVKSVRKGYEDYKVVRPWTVGLSGSVDKAKAWSERLQSIATRQQLSLDAKRSARP